DAADRGAVAPVGREVDFDHGVIEARPRRVIGADRRVVRQFDDAFVVVGDVELEFGNQHAAAFHAADGADGERYLLARDERAGRHEYAFHAGTRVGRAAYHLYRLASAGIDHADAQAISVGMLFGGYHARDGERREQLSAIRHALDFEPDHGELLDDRLERRVSLEMLLEPRQGEFHEARSPEHPKLTR